MTLSTIHWVPVQGKLSKVLCRKLGAMKITPSDFLHQEYLTINFGSTSDWRQLNLPLVRLFWRRRGRCWPAGAAWGSQDSPPLLLLSLLTPFDSQTVGHKYLIMCWILFLNNFIFCILKCLLFRALIKMLEDPKFQVHRCYSCGCQYSWSGYSFNHKLGSLVVSSLRRIKHLSVIGDPRLGWRSSRVMLAESLSFLLLFFFFF